MYEPSESFLSLFLISIGASIGSFLRLQLTKFLDKFLLRRYLSILFINILTTFVLGLFISKVPDIIEPKNIKEVELFIAIGLFGGLSTFSTFINDLFLLYSKKNWKDFYLLAIYSIFGGIIFASLGYRIGNV